MTIDEPQIKQCVREFLQKNPHSGATVLHRRVFEQGKGSFGETAIWKTIKAMAKNGELEVDLQENKRTFYSLGDITREISKTLDTLTDDLETIQESLNDFHNKYHTTKSQTKLNYLTRLMELANISRSLLKTQSFIFLVVGFPDFVTHKSWKHINKTIDELWNSIRGNASHQLDHEGKFFQELIWSLRGNASYGHFEPLHSDSKK